MLVTATVAFRDSGCEDLRGGTMGIDFVTGYLLLTDRFYMMLWLGFPSLSICLLMFVVQQRSSRLGVFFRNLNQQASINHQVQRRPPPTQPPHPRDSPADNTSSAPCGACKSII